MRELIAAIIGIIDIYALFLVASAFGVISSFNAKFPVIGSITARIMGKVPDDDAPNPAQAAFALILCFSVSASFVILTLVV